MTKQAFCRRYTFDVATAGATEEAPDVHCLRFSSGISNVGADFEWAERLRDPAFAPPRC